MNAKLTLSKIVSGERELIFLPRINGGAGRPLMLLAHGAGGTAGSWADGSAQIGASRIATKLSTRYACIAPDWGGLQTFASDVVLTRFDQYIAWAETNLPDVITDKVFIFGGSMGNGTALRCALDRPDQVRAVGAAIPLCDLVTMRDDNRGGSKAVIDTAWGLDSEDPMPSRGDLMTRAEAGELEGLPWKAWSSDFDTLTIWSEVLDMVAAIGTTASAVDTSDFDHSDASIISVNPDDVLDFFLALEP